MNSSMRDLLKELRAAGWTVTRPRSGHLRATHPGATAPLFMPATPSDVRAIRNIRAQARRLLGSSNKKRR